MRYLIVRLGAIGDCIGVTPLIRYLKAQGNEVCLLTSETGQTIFANNPHIDKLKVHIKDSIADDNLGTYFKSIKQAWECDEVIDLNEVWEVNIVCYPAYPKYNYSKPERKELCDKNYYEEVFRKSTCMSDGNYNPELFFTQQEEKAMQRFWTKDKYVILWGLSGSSRNKLYPYSRQIIKELIKDENVVVITVGDEKCQMLEVGLDDRVIKKSGIWDIREAMLACKYADLVVSLRIQGYYTLPGVSTLRR